MTGAGLGVANWGSRAGSVAGRFQPITYIGSLVQRFGAGAALPFRRMVLDFVKAVARKYLSTEEHSPRTFRVVTAAVRLPS